MADVKAKTIQIFLPGGEPRGIRVAELTTRIVQAVLIPRSDMGPAKRRPELDHVAVYFLFGESEDQAKPIVYVGQTEDVRKRLDYHNSNKDFWRTAVLGISKTHSFTQAHIRYLEWYCILRAREIGRFKLDNDQLPTKPFVTEAMEADLLDAFETLSVLVSTLGFPVFEPIVKPQSVDQFYLKGKDASAEGGVRGRRVRCSSRIPGKARDCTVCRGIRLNPAEKALRERRPGRRQRTTAVYSGLSFRHSERSCGDRSGPHVERLGRMEE